MASPEAYVLAYDANRVGVLSLIENTGCQKVGIRPANPRHGFAGRLRKNSQGNGVRRDQKHGFS